MSVKAVVRSDIALPAVEGPQLSAIADVAALDDFDLLRTRQDLPRPAVNLLGVIDEEKGALSMRYTQQGQSVEARVCERSKKNPNGVVLRYGDYDARPATLVELLTLNELAERALVAQARQRSADAPVQRERLQRMIGLIGAEARARFASGSPLFDAQTRDVTHSGVAGAKLLLSPPRDLDEAFDGLVASASGRALVRRHVDNVLAWNAKWDLLTKPQKSFAFSYFSIEHDVYGFAYLGALLALRLRGVEVKGITDYLSNAVGRGFTSRFRGRSYLQALATAGASIAVYNEPASRLRTLLREGLSFGVLCSNHDKFCVADGGTDRAEGASEGRNVAGPYHQDPRDNPMSWRDDSAQIIGRVATDGLLEALAREMRSPAAHSLRPDREGTLRHARELLGAAQLMEEWLRSAPLPQIEKEAARRDPKTRQALADALFHGAMQRLDALDFPLLRDAPPLSAAETAHLRALAFELSNDLELKGSRAVYDAIDDYHPAEVKILDQVGSASAPPGDRFNEIGPALLQLIRGARKRIVIQNPYLVLTEPMMQALQEASARGVKIDIVTNSPESTDSRITQGFFLNDWMGFLERVPTARLFVAMGQRKFHAKAFVIDESISADTSYNADLLSSEINGEIALISRSRQFAAHLISVIQSDLDEPANAFREWSIQRDAQGRPIRGPKGELLAARGPEHDVRPEILKKYRPIRLLSTLLTRTRLGAALDHRTAMSRK